LTCIAQAKQAKYDKTMRTELDIIAEKAYVREEGLAEGRAEGRAEEKKALTAEHAKKMKAESIPPEVISRVTGLGLEEIAAL
jgi:predicted transposase YdaD